MKLSDRIVRDLDLYLSNMQNPYIRGLMWNLRYEGYKLKTVVLVFSNQYQLFFEHYLFGKPVSLEDISIPLYNFPRHFHILEVSWQF